ncbi:MAG TPA: DNA-binding domain-containing protein [Polyangia bacterium]
MKLADTQAWFYQLVTARESVAATVATLGPQARRALDEIVAGDARLPAAARLEIYADMYFARLRDVLRDEYPKSLMLLGAAAFHDLVVDYLSACPPSHPSLRELGARLPGFLAEHPVAAERPWAAELARLERARLELFDGPDAEPLTIESLRARPPERFATLSLRLVPCQGLLALLFDVATLWRADDPGTVTPRPATGAVLVWRREREVLHRGVGDEEASWLRRLASDDVAFEALCAGLADGRTDEAAAARAFELVGRWASDGLLRAA